MTADATTSNTTSPAVADQNQTQEDSSSLLNSVSSFFSSLLPTARADDGEGEQEESESKDDGETEEGGEDAAEEEEEEDEPEDEQPAIYEACENSAKCKSAKSHFEHCQERVSEGKGFHGEDCIEEFCEFETGDGSTSPTAHPNAPRLRSSPSSSKREESILAPKSPLLRHTFPPFPSSVQA
ncbi:hypothetical protein CF319_g3002 [Tilletia indica]|nr:hypothetical protein CF319_g3002 [Tilletia indica]